MLVVIVAGAAVVTVDCSKLRPSITVTAFYQQVGQLTEGADVQLAGRVVGQVDAIQLVPMKAVRDETHPLHPDGGVALRLHIQKRYAGWAAPNGEYFITAKGVLGEPYVEIGPPPGGAVRERGLEDGDQVRGIDPPRMDQVLVRSFANMTAFRRLLDEITPSATALRAALDRLGDELDAMEPQPGAYGALRRSVGELGDAWGALARDWRAADVDPAALARMGRSASDVLDRARGELQSIGAALDRLTADIDRVRTRLPDDLADRLDRALTEARAAIARLETIAATGQELAARVRRGQGTIGALMNDPEFSDDAKQLGRILKREPWRVLGHPLPERAPPRK
jgi:phospholipid/cholesterol/gamma-HCH transport system substrate-binding protein